tara:strand:- start:1678 stop:2928 length:1251 start_codon:yes stop_codon:yes gene_type:complete
MRRVVVTGIGLLTSIGNNSKTSWHNLLNAKSGIKKIDHFDVADLPAKIAGYINNDPSSQDYFNRSSFLDPKDIKRNDRFIQYGLVAAKMAIDDANLNDLRDEDRLKVGVSVGSGIGGLETIYEGSLTINNLQPKKLSPFFIPSSLVNLLSGQISIKYGFKGPNHSVVTACATGAHSIGDSSEMIKRGAADVMIAGGAEAAVCKLGIAGFCAARSLSTSFNETPKEASRPWDKDRDGFVMGEGSGILVLEEMNYAKKRGAKIYAELVGYGMSGDAHHITAPAEDGDGGYRAMNEALKMANISSDKVEYINAHGTSTIKGDAIELNAISRLFKNNIFVSSTKSSIGHLLGAAGSVESIFSILSLNDNILPATLNLNNPIETSNINLIPKTPIEKNITYVLSNSFGFGGTNTALLFKSI